MHNITTSLNEEEYKQLCRICEKLGESEYTFLKKAIMKRLAEANNVLAKADRWILEGKI